MFWLSLFLIFCWHLSKDITKQNLIIAACGFAISGWNFYSLPCVLASALPPELIELCSALREAFHFPFLSIASSIPSTGQWAFSNHCGSVGHLQILGLQSPDHLQLTHWIAAGNNKFIECESRHKFSYKLKTYASDMLNTSPQQPNEGTTKNINYKQVSLVVVTRVGASLCCFCPVGCLELEVLPRFHTSSAHYYARRT